MNRNRFLNASFVLALFAIIALFKGQAEAQQWARDMFPVSQHDFEVVPRGAKTEYEFKFKNKYKENVHVASVRTSCQCTLPRIGKNDLKTYEEGTIIAEFNTRAFIGARSAVITVVFDKPFHAEVQLTVKGNIRSDIVPEPGEIQFGDVDIGTGKSTEVKITYLGSSKWEIEDVLSANQNLAVKLSPAKSVGNKVEYLMDVRLKDDAPAGELNAEIVLKTNEAQYNQVTLPVRANIVPPLSMPATVELGTLKAGMSHPGKMVIKGKKPFKIEKIECEDGRFVFNPSQEEKAVHLIPFEFKCDDKIGAFRQVVVVRTSLEMPSSAETAVTGNITQ